MIKKIDPFPAWQFSLFRIVLGIYLLIHFVHLIPSSPDIWSREGMLGDASLNFTYGMFPNILLYFDSPIQIQIFIAVMALLSLCILLGVFRKGAALLLWYGWACLFHRNNLIANPGLPMVGWLLLALVLIPLGEPLALRKKKEGEEAWFMPAPLFWGAWLIAGVSYTLSGFDKFLSPSWRDGTAILHLLHNPLARDWFVRDLLLALPLPFIYVMTWLSLALEISFGFFCLFRKTRALAWFSIMGMHIGILTVVNFVDLTLGVMMLHLFAFDPRWFLPEKKEDNSRVVFFDGVCGLCNKAVNFLMANDQAGVLKFSPLQGKLAKEICSEQAGENSESIIYFRNGKCYDKSTAVIKIARELGGILVLLQVFLLIPKFLRDIVYSIIAKNRYRFFGKEAACRIPTPEERARFLD